jgi:hypothetical protein
MANAARSGAVVLERIWVFPISHVGKSSACSTQGMAAIRSSHEVQPSRYMEPTNARTTMMKYTTMIIALLLSANSARAQARDTMKIHDTVFVKSIVHDTLYSATKNERPSLYAPPVSPLPRGFLVRPEDCPSCQGSRNL